MEPPESETVVYHWPLYRHLSRLIPILTVLLLLVFAPNRRPGAWPVLLPALILLPILPLPAHWTGLTMYGLYFIVDAASILVFGLTVLWLSAYMLADLPRRATVLYAFGFLVFSGILGLTGISTFAITEELLMAGLVYAIAIVVALAALFLSGFSCRKRYSPGRFLIRLFAVTVLGFGGVWIVLHAIFRIMPLLLSDEISFNRIRWAVQDEMIPVLIAFPVLFVILLPFMALAFRAPVYRSRFHAIYRLPGMAFQEKPVYPNNITGGDNP